MTNVVRPLEMISSASWISASLSASRALVASSSSNTGALRNIARAAGCHIYSDGNDVVYANRNILCVYSPAGGKRTISLPEKAKVVDLLENRVVSVGAAEFSLAMAPNSTTMGSAAKVVEIHQWPMGSYP